MHGYITEMCAYTCEVNDNKDIREKRGLFCYYEVLPLSVKRMRRLITDWEKIFTIYRGLLSKIYKNK